MKDEMLRPVLSLIMPVHNEGATLRTVLERLGSVEMPVPYELIVVDDGSTDGAVNRIERRWVSNAVSLRIVRAQMNHGKGSALRKGFSLARGEILGVQDADLEYNPVQIPELVRPILDDNADVVFGSRQLGTNAYYSFSYMLGNRIISLIASMLFGRITTDSYTCYKFMRREAFESLRLTADGFEIEAELTGGLLGRGWRYCEVPIAYAARSREEGKKIRLSDGLRAIATFVKVRLLLGLGRRQIREHRAAAITVDESLIEALDALDGAKNYRRWILSLAERHLVDAREILELGAGHGTFTEHLARSARVTAVEARQEALRRLRARFHDNDRVVVSGSTLTTLPPDTFDVAFLCNVLEHIEDDVAALSELSRVVRPGGTVIVFSPAFRVLYSNFDARIGHHHRYLLPELAQRLAAAGLEVIESRYVNSVGFFGWLLLVKVLGITPRSARMVQLFDRVGVPLLRQIERRIAPPFGQSVLVVGRA